MGSSGTHGSVLLTLGEEVLLPPNPDPRPLPPHVSLLLMALRHSEKDGEGSPCLLAALRDTTATLPERC